MAIYNFSGKTILVTGAGAGIGKAIVRKLIGCGAQVVALSLVQAELDSLQKEMPGIRAIQVDLRDWQTARNIVSELGPIDGLVNCAGVGLVAPFLELTEEQFDLTYSVNVKAVINLSQVVAKSMIERKVAGAIVNISSIAALKALNEHAVYCASKASVDALTKVMALELGPHQIRVNSVNPTVVMTDLGRQVWSDPEKRRKLIERIPLGRFAEEGEVVSSVLFLLSEESSCVTGTSLVIDGGFATN